MTTSQLYYATARALLIGIDSYQDARLTPLGEAEHDAQIMAETLSAAPYGFQVETLLGAGATRKNIAAALGSLALPTPDTVSKKTKTGLSESPVFILVL